MRWMRKAFYDNTAILHGSSASFGGGLVWADWIAPAPINRIKHKGALFNNNINIYV